MTDEVELKDDDVDAADAALEAAFAERQAHKGIAPKDVDPPEVVDKLAEVAERQEAAPAATPEPAASVPDEPFEGYSALPEAVRKRFDEAQKKAAEADRLAAEVTKAREQYNALHGRVKPLQQYYDQNRNQQPAKPQAPAPQGFAEWVKQQSPEYQQYAKDFTEEARVQFDVFQRANAEADKRIQSVEEKVESRFRELQQRNELDRLARTHSDFKEYSATGTKGAELRKWAESQGADVIAAIESDSADDVSQALSLYKWESAEPIVRETYSSTDFQDWLGKQSIHVQAMARSLDIEDRKDALHWFIGHLEQSAPADPNAAKGASLAAKRQRQAANVSPLVRQTAAPATAADSSEDAELDAVAQERQRWRNRNR